MNRRPGRFRGWKPGSRRLDELQPVKVVANAYSPGQVPGWPGRHQVCGMIGRHTRGTSLRILHVSEPTTGGVPTYLSRVAALQVKSGNTVASLVSDRHPRMPGVDEISWQFRRSSWVDYYRAVRTIARTAEAFNPDVVHLHSFFAGLFGRLPSAVRGAFPTVYQPHAWAADGSGVIGGRMAAMWEARASTRIDLLVTNCVDELRQGKSLGVNTPGHVVGQPVDLSHFRPPTIIERAEARRSVGQARPFALVLGRIARQKGQDRLVAAWEESPPPGYDLIIVGDGDTAELRSAAPREWGRTIKHRAATSDVRRWMWAANVLAVPSRYEGFPFVVAEGMATGLPIVATSFNGAQEAVVSGGPPAGAVVSTVDDSDMSSFLAECSSRIGPNRTIDAAQERDSARLRAVRLFEPEMVLSNLQLAYEEAILRWNRK